jgi:hypothetical protein
LVAAGRPAAIIAEVVHHHLRTFLPVTAGKLQEAEICPAAAICNHWRISRGMDRSRFF